MTKKQKAELEYLAGMPDEEIDLSDIPEIKDWSKAEVGKFCVRCPSCGSVRRDARGYEPVNSGAQPNSGRVLCRHNWHKARVA